MCVFFRTRGWASGTGTPGAWYLTYSCVVNVRVCVFYLNLKSLSIVFFVSVSLFRFFFFLSFFFFFCFINWFPLVYFSRFQVSFFVSVRVRLRFRIRRFSPYSFSFSSPFSFSFSYLFFLL